MTFETYRFLSLAVLFSLGLVLTSLLAGCSMSLKEIECVARDNTRNPCN
jgi:hypothetical protein